MTANTGMNLQSYAAPTMDVRTYRKYETWEK
jgi:hypothetical protein